MFKIFTRWHSADIYYCISYCGHRLMKLNLIFIYLLTAKNTTQNLKDLTGTQFLSMNILITEEHIKEPK